MIETALEAEREQHRIHMDRERELITARVTEDVTARVTAQVANQVAEQMQARMAEQLQAQMAAQVKMMQEYEDKMRHFIEGSGRVVTSEPEVTNVVAQAPVSYRSSVDNQSGNSIYNTFVCYLVI